VVKRGPEAGNFKEGEKKRKLKELGRRKCLGALKVRKVAGWRSEA
jgi:hypothetical protein